MQKENVTTALSKVLSREGICSDIPPDNKIGIWPVCVLAILIKSRLGSNPMTVSTVLEL